MKDLEVINQRLLDNYGRGVAELPSYRVVWSSDEREVRTGVFTKMLGDIYLGTEMATREVPKYPMFPDCFILEHAQPNAMNFELKAKVSYEPLWVFKDSDGNSLPPDWEAIEKIIYFHIYREAPKSAKALEHEYEEKKQKEEDKVLDFLKHDEAFPNRMYDTPIVTVN